MSLKPVGATSVGWRHSAHQMWLIHVFVMASTSGSRSNNIRHNIIVSDKLHLSVTLAPPALNHRHTLWHATHVLIHSREVWNPSNDTSLKSTVSDEWAQVQRHADIWPPGSWLRKRDGRWVRFRDVIVVHSTNKTMAVSQTDWRVLRLTLNLFTCYCNKCSRPKLRE